MSILNNPAALFVAIVVAIIIVFLTYSRIRTVRKEATRKAVRPPDNMHEAYLAAKKSGHQGTFDEWAASLAVPGDRRAKAETVDDGFKPVNRAERRAAKFANQTEEELRDRMHAHQNGVFSIFIENLEAAKVNGQQGKWSLLTFANTVLDLAESNIVYYTTKSKDVHEASTFLSPYQQLVMMQVSAAIMEYSGGKALQAVTIELVHFVEKHFRMTGLMGVLYRHKGHIHYNDRCECMSRSILGFFSSIKTSHDAEALTMPVDFVNPAHKTSWDTFRKVFFHQAVDASYTNFIKHVEKTNYAAATREEQLEREKNRRQRARRVSKRSKRS